MQATRRAFGFTLIMFCVPAISGYAGEALEQINNFHRVSPNLSTAGQLEAPDIELLASQGYQVIVDLRELSENDPEPQRVEQAGMTYLNVPVSSKNPDQAMLTDFLQAMKESEGRKVLVHCRLNRRASAMTYLYQVVAQGENPDLAIQHVLAIGEPNETWQAFIDASLSNNID